MHDHPNPHSDHYPLLAFRLRRALDPDSADDAAVIISASELKKLRGVYQIYRALDQVPGITLGPACVRGSTITSAIVYSRESDLLGRLCLAEAFQRTAAELQSNASRTVPLPHAQVLSVPSLVPVISAASTAHRKHGTTAYIFTGTLNIEIPTLEPADFAESAPEPERNKVGTWLITGITRHQGRTGLLLGETALCVDLTHAGDRWGWAQVREVLDQPTYLDGELRRLDSAWTMVSGSLVRQSAIS